MRKEVAEHLDPEYPLHTYSVESLREMMEQPWEHSEFDLAVAEHLLKQRGEAPPQVNFAPRSHGPLADHAQPLPGTLRASMTVKIWGLASVLCGGLFGIIIGYNLAYATTVHKDGTLHYVYDEHGRDVGRTLMIVGIPVLLALGYWSATALGWLGPLSTSLPTF